MEEEYDRQIINAVQLQSYAGSAEKFGFSEVMMSNMEPRQVVKAPDVLLQDLEGEAVLLNLANGQYYGLDEASYHMYKMLVSSSSVQAAYEALLGEYEVEPGQLRSDLDKFLAHLLENGLVLKVNDEPG